jgi:hypothetical protein
LETSLKQLLVATKDSEEPAYYFPVPIMPQRVSPIEVIALAETVERSGSIELSDLDRHFSRHSSAHLLSVLKAGTELGLIQRDGSIVNVTDLGIGFARASDGKEEASYAPALEGSSLSKLP